MKLALLLLLLQTTAYAEFDAIESAKTLDQIKAACNDPASAGNQIAPQSIKIFCSEEKNGWEAAEPGSLSETAYDLVTSMATTDKPNVGAAPEQKSYDSAPFLLICPKYQEYVLQANQNIFFTCTEILQINDLNVFCKNAFAVQSADNPNFYTKTLTGKTKDTCIAPTPGTFGGTPVQDPVQQPIRRGRGQR